jgi:hypothetical protein
MQANGGRGTRVGFPTDCFLPRETVSDYLRHTGRTAEGAGLQFGVLFLFQASADVAVTPAMQLNVGNFSITVRQQFEGKAV